MDINEKQSLVIKGMQNGYGTTANSESNSIQDGSCQCIIEDPEQIPGGKQSPPVVTKTTLTRFWILFAFSTLGVLHTVLWNTWGPINESVEAAFPTWTSSTVSMTVNWTTIFFLLFVVPMCFAIQRCGMRVVVILCTAVMFIGTVIRCTTTTIPWFTVTAELCSVLVGVASTLILSGPSLIAADWFPTNERTTAVAVIMGASQLGSVGSYLEPLIVRTPGPGVSVDDIKHDIMNLLYIGAGVTGALLLAILAYFPSKPAFPPSVSSSTNRLDVYSGAKTLVKNKDFLLLLFAYGISIGPPVAWIPVLDYSLLPLGFHQDDSMWIGLISVIVSSLFPVFFGYFIDQFRSHMRTALVILMSSSSAFFYWFLLLSYGAIPISAWQVYLSVVASVTLNYTTIPLFLEIAVEVAYPVPEILVSGFFIAADNLFTTLFLLAFLIPNSGYLWMAVTLTLTSSFTIVPLVLAKIDYNKTDMDLEVLD